MIGEIFNSVVLWLSNNGPLAFTGAFVWGLTSVLLSPCAMASVPLIVAYVAGQAHLEDPKRGFMCALFFSIGLFLSLTIIGVVCSLLGRLLGDVGVGLQVLVGIFLVWIGFRLFSQRSCSFSLPYLKRIGVTGNGGGFLIGLSYGIVAGPCTFGFVAPILAIVTVSGDVARGILMMTLFSMGHCLPLVLAGTFIAKLRRYLENRRISQASLIFQRMAGVVICGLGLYFVLNPFLALMA